MKSRFLFPHRVRILGYLCFLAYIPVALLKKYLRTNSINSDTPFFTEHFFTTVILLLIVMGLLLIAFSKEKIEDERIAQLRLDSLQWSIYFNYIGLIAGIIVINDWHMFVGVAAHFIITPLLFFIIRFRWVVYQSGRLLEN